MLIDLDETLFHQGAATMGQAMVTDHRFYDRSSWTTFSPDGSVGLLSGMAVYKNLNLAEAFASTQAEGLQRNLRLSRPLRPFQGGLSFEVGPMRTEWIEPHKQTRFVRTPDEDGDGFDITFRPSIPPYLEARHHGSTDGRVHTDYLRIDNVGWADGHIVAGGKRHEIERWFAWRDHSWGVRPGVSYEPFTGTRAGAGLPSSIMAGGLGIMVMYLGFATETHGGFFQLKEDENGRRLYMHGSIGRNGEPMSAVSEIRYSCDMVEGTRLFRKVSLELVTENGRDWKIEVDAIGRSWVYKGTGYDSGYSDGKGQGVWRGDALTVEKDIYDITDFETVRKEDGSTMRPPHREQPVRITVNGEPGYGHFPFVIIGRNPRLGVL